MENVLGEFKQRDNVAGMKDGKKRGCGIIVIIIIIIWSPSIAPGTELINPLKFLSDRGDRNVFAIYNKPLTTDHT